MSTWATQDFSRKQENFSLIQAGLTEQLENRIKNLAYGAKIDIFSYPLCEKRITEDVILKIQEISIEYAFQIKEWKIYFDFPCEDECSIQNQAYAIISKSWQHCGCTLVLD